MLASRQALPLKAAAILLLLWGLVWAGLRVSRAWSPSPEKLAAYVDAHPLGEIEDPKKRLEVIGKVADMLNQIDPGELRRVMETGQDDTRREFFEAMTEDEQRFFLEKRIGKAFDQMMQAFNQMGREERQQVVERTLRQMRQDGGGRDDLARMEETDPEMAEKIVNEGLRAYFQRASAETKLDLAPVLEQMQLNLGPGPGSRRR